MATPLCVMRNALKRTSFFERLDGQLELALECWGLNVVDNAGGRRRARRGGASPAREGDPATTRRTSIYISCTILCYVCVCMCFGRVGRIPAEPSPFREPSPLYRRLAAELLRARRGSQTAGASGSHRNGFIQTIKMDAWQLNERTPIGPHRSPRTYASGKIS